MFRSTVLSMKVEILFIFLFVQLQVTLTTGRVQVTIGREDDPTEITITPTLSEEMRLLCSRSGLVLSKTWSSSGSKITNSDIVTGDQAVQTLTISTIKPTHTGIYSCGVTMSSVTIHYSVDLKLRPEIENITHLPSQIQNTKATVGFIEGSPCICVSWDMVEDNRHIMTYVISHSTKPGTVTVPPEGAERITLTGANVTSTVITNLLPGRTYYLWVSATISAVEGQHSKRFNITTLENESSSEIFCSMRNLTKVSRNQPAATVIITYFSGGFSAGVTLCGLCICIGFIKFVCTRKKHVPHSNNGNHTSGTDNQLTDCTSGSNQHALEPIAHQHDQKDNSMHDERLSCYTEMFSGEDLEELTRSVCRRQNQNIEETDALHPVQDCKSVDLNGFHEVKENSCQGMNISRDNLERIKRASSDRSLHSYTDLDTQQLADTVYVQHIYQNSKNDSKNLQHQVDKHVCDHDSEAKKQITKEDDPIDQDLLKHYEYSADYMNIGALRIKNLQS